MLRRCFVLFCDKTYINRSAVTYRSMMPGGGLTWKSEN